MAVCEPSPRVLSREQARRIAVRAQLLSAPRPDGVIEVVRHLGFLQVEPTEAVAPSAEVVLWSRLGDGFDRAELTDAVDEQRLIDLHGRLRPPEHLAALRAEMRDWDVRDDLRGWQVAILRWVRANDRCRRDVLERLRQDGPLPAAELPDTCEVPWRSGGWNDGRNVVRLLDCLTHQGEVAAAGRDGRDRLWDLAGRVYPDDPVPPLAQARRLQDERLLRSLGIARARMAQPTTAEPTGVHDAGVAAVVEGVKGAWRVDPELLDAPFEPRTVLLSPLDRLVFDRKRMAELFEFDYQLEMYKPAATRRFGYWAMPVLHGDRLVGKLDATADRTAGVLRVDAVHRDGAWTADVEDAVQTEIDALARWLGLARSDR